MTEYDESYDYEEDEPDTFGFLPPTDCDKPYTVTEVNNGVADILESGNTLIWFVGEISNYKRHTSGHCYLRLKDHSSQLPAVIWNSNANRIKFKLEDGLEVTGIASLRVYRKGGYYQLDIRRIQPAGVGELYAAFEALKERLSKEGLFDENHKKELPRAIARLGVVTSRTGAALQDIVRVVARRSPRTDIIIHNARVQGDAAAGEIAAAIRNLSDHANVDAMIVGRGGGSIEDLWAFNEEQVARAIYECPVPVISAVGHETDFTIADFVADLRAPTPSAAAELAVPDEEESRRRFVALARQFASAGMRLFHDRRRDFERVCLSPALRGPARRLLEVRQTVDDSHARALRAMALALRERTAKLAAHSGRLEALSPLRVLARGYSVVSTTEGSAVRSSSEVHKGDTVDIRFDKGHARATIDSTDNKSSSS